MVGAGIRIGYAWGWVGLAGWGGAGRGGAGREEKGREGAGREGAAARAWVISHYVM